MNRLRSARGAASLPLAAALVLLGCQSAPPSGASGSEPAAASASRPVSATASEAKLPATAPAAPAANAGADEPPRLHVRADGQLGPGNNTLFIDLAAPAGAKLTAESPISVRGSGGIGLRFPDRLSGSLGSHPMPLRLPIEVSDGATGPAQVEVSYYWCADGNEAACRREQAQLNVELDLSGSGAGGEAHLSYRARGDRS